VKKSALLIVMILIPSLSLLASSPYLSLSLGVNYSALGFATMLKPDSDNKALFPDGYEKIRDKAVRLLLEEARWVFSGMVYGYSFRYVPGNRDEGLEEVFDLNPVYSIPKGDPALKVYQVQDDYESLNVLFQYWPDSLQMKRLRVSTGGGFLSASAEGSVPMMLKNARLDSIKEAVKQSLRSNLRSLFYNRPLEVSGFLYLSASPVITLKAGEYRSRVKILYRREDLKTFPLNY